ncbi:hypothetical protein AB1Y20_006467 [Prymnesium parvum]|uniref:Carotenoid oxygenase n=1 Tax=Prymnesium parvum TaxID=97485 RepID=A0AB34IZW2_PRYPA
MLSISPLLFPLPLAPTPARRSPHPSLASAPSPTETRAAPSSAVWNDTVSEAWTRAYSSAAASPTSYEIEEIDGAIPAALRGTLFRNGPGNFERGGVRYEHVLDGDGLLCRFTLDGSKGTAHFARRFVETAEYVEEAEADAILHRNTFGTQPPGLLSNVLRLSLKNPANTHVVLHGGVCLALWEAALPSRIDPHTLAYEGTEDFGGALKPGWLSVTSGLGEAADSALGLGEAYTAHPREDRARGRMVGWSWAAPAVGDDLAVKILEFDLKTGEVLRSTAAALPAVVAPHDFALTANWYVFVLNAMDLQIAPFILGTGGPTAGLGTTGEGVTLRLIPRPDGTAAGRPPLTLRTDDPYFAIHHATAFESVSEADDDELEIRLYTAAWPYVGRGSFLKDWGGAVPCYDDGKIRPTQLLESTIRISHGEIKVGPKRALAGGACIDHPHCDPRFDGDERMRYLYMSYCNDEGVSGSPTIGWARYDRHTDTTLVWRAPPLAFCEELVVIPRSETAQEDSADVWLAGLIFDSESGRSSLAILNGDDIEAGPVCRLWLRDHVPHGLHGSFTTELFGPLSKAS